MIKFEISAIVDKPIDVVEQALINPVNMNYWTSDLEKYELVKGNPGKVGAVGLMHFRKKNGEIYTMEDTLVLAETGKKYVSEITSSMVDATVDTTIEDVEGKTKVSVTWTGKAKGLMLKVMFPMGKGKIKKQAQIELDNFKNLVETRGADFSIIPDES